MSRIAKKNICIPKGVEIEILSEYVIAKGPKGNSKLFFNNKVVSIKKTDNDILNIEPKFGWDDVSALNEIHLPDVKNTKKYKRSIFGTTRANLENLIIGVFSGYEKKLVLFGVGYRAKIEKDILNLSLGFSHPVNFSIPDGILIETPINTEIIIKGVDKSLVGQVASDIKSIRPVEPYKGKGIRYSDEKIILKETNKK